jgi:hypothetical protein
MREALRYIFLSASCGFQGKDQKVVHANSLMSFLVVVEARERLKPAV